jgi:fructokinase
VSRDRRRPAPPPADIDPAGSDRHDLGVIVVAGENVVDLVPEGAGLLRPILGGGPANVAVATARLGAPVAMAARLGGDPFGAAFRSRLVAAGVDPRYLVGSADPSALALVTLDGADARYDFWLTGGADFNWTDSQLPDLTADDVLHLGSLAAFRPPGADVLARWAARHRRVGLVTLDPNLRPIVLADRAAALRRLESLVGSAHVVKASVEDLRAAYPDLTPERVARRWLAGPGPALVVLTRGSAGLAGLTRTARFEVATPPVRVVDTIGAGDAAMGALLATLYERGLDGVLVDLPGTLRRTCAAGTLACTRAGASPPDAAEVDALAVTLDVRTITDSDAP